jgi:hypothetical protein
MDTDGLIHNAKVETDSVYEAAIMGLKAFKKALWDGRTETGNTPHCAGPTTCCESRADLTCPL